MKEKTYTERSFNKIVWALNPFDKNPKLWQAHYQILRNIEKIKESKITPVYVLSEYANVAIETYGQLPPSGHLILENMRKRMTSSKLAHFNAPVLLREPMASHRTESKRLIDYCEKNKISMIAVATHARKALARFMMGSFAESLLLQSPVPLLFVNPRHKISKSIRKILFPTDLGENSRKAFCRALDLALELKAQLSIYSVARTKSYQGLLLADDTGLLGKAIEEEDKIRDQRLKEFVCFTEEAGVIAKVIKEKTVLSVAEAIAKQAAKSKVDLIAIAAKQIPAVPTMAGSITRQLIRKAPCPVYVYRPDH